MLCFALSIEQISSFVSANSILLRPRPVFMDRPLWASALQLHIQIIKYYAGNSTHVCAHTFALNFADIIA